MPNGIVTNTNFTQKVDNFKSRTPEYDPHSGKHLWIILGMYKCDPVKMEMGEQLLMDFENLFSIEGPGCYYCEKPYSKSLASMRCKGEPDD